MDVIRGMYDACEAMVFSTDKSKQRYTKKLDDLERKFDSDLSKFAEIADMSDAILKKVEDITDEKQREKAIKKEVSQIIKFCQRNNIMELEPMNLIKTHKHILVNLFNRADRKDPEIQKKVDELKATLSEGGKLYKKAQDMHDRIFGNEAASKADKQYKNQQAAAAYQLQQQQQMMLQQQMQMQIHMQIHQEMMMQSQIMHQQAMMAAGMM